ncbi:MAG: hypothetical protein ABFR95_01890 [Actinomycetota bacterium]
MDGVLDRPELALLVAAFAVAGGFTVTVFASRRAVASAVQIAAGTRIPPFVIGITLLSIGTDLPEIANSIIASVSGHGDVNVGDSVGSAATQTTLVLGLLPILGGAFVCGRKRITTIGAATVGALVFGAFLMADGTLSRADALLLIAAWLAGSALAWLKLPRSGEPALPVAATLRPRQFGMLAGALGVVILGASSAVWGLTRIAEVLSTPEYLIAFFVASIGTSLPELGVGLSAIRQGQHDLAIGDALGSSFADSTLSIAAGPLIAPIAVSTRLVVTGSLAAAAVIAVVVALLSIRRRHDWMSGGVLILLYVGFYLLWLVA